MGVIHMQMYGSMTVQCSSFRQIAIARYEHIQQDSGNMSNASTAATTQSTMDEFESLLPMDRDDFEAQVLPNETEERRHRRYPSHPPCSISKIKCGCQGHRRISSHTSEGRPPRHPGRRISKFDADEWHIHVVYNHDEYRNEKFPTEILTRFERKRSTYSSSESHSL
mmetsp:Transcript_28262/g.51093  ORF Transcript_28262/g.51093 Transcript_28262/m.51093 type:complete len:167 (+) Transcript_28262:88-588(+)